MKVWTSCDFEGHWVGTAAVVVAPDEDAARALLEDACRKAGLKGFDGTLQPLPLEQPAALILQDGDY